MKKKVLIISLEEQEKYWTKCSLACSKHLKFYSLTKHFNGMDLDRAIYFTRERYKYGLKKRISKNSYI